MSRDDPRNPKAAGAIAKLLPQMTVSPEVRGVGMIQGIAESVAAGDVVTIAGRAGILSGRVVKYEEYTPIKGIRDSWVAVFRQLIRVAVTDSSLYGSNCSGAPVLSQDHKLVGMAYAATKTDLYVIPIQPILDLFDVELVR